MLKRRKTETWTKLLEELWVDERGESDPLEVARAGEALQGAVKKISGYLSSGRKSGDELQALCPFHDDRNLGNFRVNLTTGFFFCWACGARGGIHKLIAGLGVPDAEAKALLRSIDFNLISEFFEQHRTSAADKVIKPLPEGILAHFPYRPKLYLDKGHSPKILDMLEVSYDPKNVRVVFPIRRSTGELVAIQSRGLLKNQIRWKFYKNELKDLLSREELDEYDLHDYEPPRREMFFNEHNVFMSLYSGRLRKPLVLVEGPGHGMRVMAAGYPCIASFGTHLSETQAGKLVGAFKRFRSMEIIIATDGDRPGRTSAIRTALDLGAGVKTRIAKIPEGLDPEDLQVRDLREILARAPLFEDLLTETSKEGELAGEILSELLSEEETRHKKEEDRKSWANRSKLVETADLLRTVENEERHAALRTKKKVDSSPKEGDYEP